MSMGLLNRSATKVELKGVHLCCDACVDGVGVALKDVEGVESYCEIGNRTVTLTADDDAAAQKALDALAAAGYHGDTGNKQLAMKAPKSTGSGGAARSSTAREPAPRGIQITKAIIEVQLALLTGSTEGGGLMRVVVGDRQRRTAPLTGTAEADGGIVPNA
jgi:copper chaperone CopZ